MKKISSIILICLLLTAVGTACTDKPEQPQPPEESYTVSLGRSALELNVYQQAALTAVIRDIDGKEAEKTLIWTSSDTDVVSVAGGIILAKGSGTAKVTATVQNTSAAAECVITVTHNGHVPVLELNKEQVVIAAGADLSISALVRFMGESSTDDDTAFEFVSADAAVATVSEEGLVTGVAAGTTKLTVTAYWRGLGGEPMAGGADAAGLRKTIDIVVK